MYDILYVTTHLAKVCIIVKKIFGIHVIKFTCHTLYFIHTYYIEHRD